MIHGFDLDRLREGRTRSISPENPTGAKGGGGRATTGTGAPYAAALGPGWKISPSIELEPGGVTPIAEIEGPGRITHLWLTAHRSRWRQLLLRAYWDGAEEPAIEVPLGDFFANGWAAFAQVSSAMVASNPHGGFNSYWPMPFREGARLTVENLAGEPVILYFQLTYDIEVELDGAAYLHAQFRRSNPLVAGRTHPIVTGVEGRGHYVGSYLAWGVNSPGWWGEGEIKFYLDGDTAQNGGAYPTICGTGTEDYFGGAWNFELPGQGYTSFTTPYLGMPQVLRPDGLYLSQQRFGLYRWHVADPITFHQDLTVDIQALGFRPTRVYEPRHDDIASTAFFYLDRPTAVRPPTPTIDDLQVDALPNGPVA